MRFTLIFFVLVSVFICSCKRTKNEAAYINALVKTNEFILDGNERMKTNVLTSSNYDPRLQTQEIIFKIKSIDRTTLSYIQKLKNSKIEINAEELVQFKKDLIKNNIDYKDWDYFFEEYYYRESEIKIIPVQVAINEILLLTNQLFSYYARNLQWSDMKIDKPQAIFKVDSNTYLALFGFGSSNKKQPNVTITSITHNSQKLSPDQYSFQFKTGFYGVILNLRDNPINKLGEYIINYEISWKKIGNIPEYKFEDISIFMIDG